MDKMLEWLKGQGIGWEFAITFGLLLYDLGKRLAEQGGVAPEVLAKREAEAMKRLGGDIDKLNDELRALVKP